MREFFRGWRRKIGVVTLGLACVSMAGWMRSGFREDRLRFKSSVGGWSCMEVASINNHISMMRQRPDLKLAFLEDLSWDLPRFFSQELVPESNQWNWSWPRTVYLDGGYVHLAIIPYWIIVLPLTLLSAYLILWKPRKAS